MTKGEHPMKYAFMSFSCPDAGFAEMLAMARQYGYDGVEPRIGSGHRHGVELDADAAARSRQRRQADDSGIAVGCIATSCRFADPATASESVRQMGRAIDLAGDLGAPAVRVFGGAVGETLRREEAVDLVAESLLAEADHAAARGVTVCMETHDQWTDPTDVAAVMQKADHPAIAVNWDIMHPVRFSDRPMDKAFEVLRPWIRHVHFHDARKADGWKLCPVDCGDIDHAAAVRLLASMPYDGYLSGEWIQWEPPEVHLPRELAAMKRLEQAAAEG